MSASAAILRTLSTSSSDPARVFDVILKSATRLCDAHLAVLNLYEGEMLRTVAQRGGKPAFVKWLFDRGAFKPPHGLKRMIRDRRPVPDQHPHRLGPDVVDRQPVPCRNQAAGDRRPHRARADKPDPHRPAPWICSCRIIRGFRPGGKQMARR